MKPEKKGQDLQELVGRAVWYQISRDLRVLLVAGCLVLTVISLSIPVVYFKSVSPLGDISEKNFLFHETNAWVFVLSAVLPMILLLLKGPQQFGLLLSLLSLGSYLIVSFGFMIFLTQALENPSILANLGFTVYCTYNNGVDCTSGLSGHLESGVILLGLCSFISFILVMIYGTEAYLNAREKSRRLRGRN
ncbi:MAG: hypothetical protein ACTSP4_09295 [Candidatus Hodarchaeales archaeon]